MTVLQAEGHDQLRSPLVLPAGPIMPVISGMPTGLLANAAGALTMQSLQTIVCIDCRRSLAASTGGRSQGYRVARVGPAPEALIAESDALHALCVARRHAASDQTLAYTLSVDRDAPASDQML
jgi:hypothetical protein